VDDTDESETTINYNGGDGPEKEDATVDGPEMLEEAKEVELEVEDATEDGYEEAPTVEGPEMEAAN
jgi:hypothetical protein